MSGGGGGLLSRQLRAIGRTPVGRILLGIVALHLFFGPVFVASLSTL